MNKKSKRHPSLIPLSHEHREILAFCLHLNKGLRKSTSMEIMAQYISWFWENILEPHFKQEEKQLFPLFSKHDVHLTRIKKDHQEIRSIMQSPSYSIELIENLQTRLNAHIRFEERVAFNYLQEFLSESKLEALDFETESSRGCAWIKPFWE